MTEDDYDKRDNTLRSFKRKILVEDPEKAYELFPSLRPKAPAEGAFNYQLDLCILEKLSSFFVAILLSSFVYFVAGVPAPDTEEAISHITVGSRCEVAPGWA